MYLCFFLFNILHTYSLLSSRLYPRKRVSAARCREKCSCVIGKHGARAGDDKQFTEENSTNLHIYMVVKLVRKKLVEYTYIYSVVKLVSYVVVDLTNVYRSILPIYLGIV